MISSGRKMSADRTDDNVGCVQSHVRFNFFCSLGVITNKILFIIINTKVDCFFAKQAAVRLRRYSQADGRHV